MPVCEPETDKSKYEDMYMRTKLSVAALSSSKWKRFQPQDEDNDLKVDTSKRQFQECLLKLFAVSVILSLM